MTTLNQNSRCPVCDAQSIEDEWLDRLEGVKFLLLQVSWIPEDVQEQLSLLLTDQFKHFEAIEDLLCPYSEQDSDLYLVHDEVCEQIDPELH